LVATSRLPDDAPKREITVTRIRTCSVAVILASLGCAAEVIQHDLSERQAVQIQVLLENVGIGATKVRDAKSRLPSYSIAVSSGEAAKARRLLVESDMPRRESRGMSETFSGDPGLIPTAMQERSRLIAALSGEVEKKLRMVPGIVDAHATVVLPDDDPLRDVDKPAERATASIVYRYLAKPEGEPKPPLAVGVTRSLVAASVPGLSASDVVVIARPSSAGIFKVVTGDPTVSFLGVRVHPSSRGRFRAVVFGLLGVSILSLGGLGLLLWRRRQAAA
jgi:type III secretion protein J